MGLSCTPPSARLSLQPRTYVWPNSEPSRLLYYSTLPAHRLALLLGGLLVVALAVARSAAPAPLTQGVLARYYPNDSWSGAPVIEQIDSEISTETLAAHPELRTLTQFTAEWTGVLVAHNPNLLRFAVKSDDGSWLWIDDRLVIDNGGVHGPQNVAADVFLERGVHAFRVRYLEAGGSSLLALGQWSRGGHIVHPAPLLPYSISYGELRARELWPLGFVALAYLTLGVIGVALIERLSHSEYLPPLTAICRDRWFLAVAGVGLTVALLHADYGIRVHGEFSGDELMPLDTLGASEYLFRGWNLRWASGQPALIALLLLPFRAAGMMFALPLVDPFVAPLMLLVIRAFSIVLLFLTFVMTFDVARSLADRMTGLFAVALLGLSPLVVYFGPFANLETTHLFWMTASWWAWINFRRKRDVLAGVMFGAAAGLSLAVKDQAYGFYLAAPFAVPAVLWYRENRGTRWGWLHSILDRRVLMIGVSTLVAFAIGQGLLWAPDRFISHVAFMTSSHVSRFQMYPRSINGYMQLFWAVGMTFMWGAGGPLAAALAGGCVTQLVQRRWARLASLFLPLVTYVVGFLGVVLYVYDRFLIGWLPLAAFIGGTFLASVLQRRTLPWVVRYGVPAFVLSVGLLNALGQNAAFRGDARYAAADWLTRHVPCGAPIGVAIDAAYLPPLGCYDVWQFLPSELDRVVRWPDYFVLSENYSQRLLVTQSGERFLRSIKSGELGYRLAFRSAADAPGWAPLFWEERFRNRREDPHTTLDKPFDAIEVWQR